MKIKGITIKQNTTCKTWYARYRQNKTQFYISAKTQKKCYDLLKEKLNIIEKEKKPKNHTLQTWYDKWLQLFKIGKIQERTLKDYKFMLKYVPKNLLNKEISKISQLDVQEMLLKIPHERQRQKNYEFLKGIFTKAQKFQIIKVNVFDMIDKPTHIKKKGIALTKEQQNIFINKCLTDDKYDIFLITLFQGLRKGEVLGITNDNLDFQNKKLSIIKSLNQENEFGKTKNVPSNRVIPIFENSLNILKKYENVNGRIFTLTNKTFHVQFKELLKECNLPSSIKLHDLRHTFITNLKNINIPEHIIQFYVGHTIGSRVTSQVYTHVNEENIVENTNIINEKLNSNSTQKKED